MTRIGAVCLITIGIWCLIEIFVQFFLPRYSGSDAANIDNPAFRWKHSCIIGVGVPLADPCTCTSYIVHMQLRVCYASDLHANGPLHLSAVPSTWHMPPLHKSCSNMLSSGHVTCLFTCVWLRE